MWSHLRMLVDCVTFSDGIRASHKFFHRQCNSYTRRRLKTRYSCLSREMLAINLRFEWNAKHSRPPARAPMTAAIVCECVFRVLSHCFSSYAFYRTILPQPNSLHFCSSSRFNVALPFVLRVVNCECVFDCLSAYSSFMLISSSCLPICRLFWHYWLRSAKQFKGEWTATTKTFSLTLHINFTPRWNADCWSEIHGWSSRDRRAYHTLRSFVGSSVFAVNSAIL